jgi:hypothetical protein
LAGAVCFLFAKIKNKDLFMKLFQPNLRPFVSSALLILACLCLAPTGSAQSGVIPVAPEAGGHVFSYSVIDVDVSAGELLVALQDEVLTRVAERGATLYAVWTPVEKPVDAPFAGLTTNQLVLMLAWSDTPVPRVEELDRDIKRLDAVTAIHSRLFDAIYLPSGLTVPTEHGFYVHREEKYSDADVQKAFRLSQEAWTTWEPNYGVKVVGLFRELNGEAGVNNLNRIAWYPDYAMWLNTRNFAQDPESARRFSERRQLLIEGSGVAIASDRLIPLADR